MDSGWRAERSEPPAPGDRYGVATSRYWIATRSWGEVSHAATGRS
jgi:hypothetical protein